MLLFQGVNRTNEAENNNSTVTFPMLEAYTNSNLITHQAYNKNAEFNDIIRVVNRFSSKLYSAILSHPHRSSKNVVFSPFCIHLMLSLIMLGAKGNTKIELAKVSVA